MKSPSPEFSMPSDESRSPTAAEAALRTITLEEKIGKAKSERAQLAKEGLARDLEKAKMEYENVKAVPDEELETNLDSMFENLKPSDKPN
jgi:hypothetical protein